MEECLLYLVSARKQRRKRGTGRHVCRSSSTRILGILAMGTIGGEPYLELASVAKDA